MTRRCLDCDHTFCLGEPTTTTSSTTAPKGSKKRKRGGPCKAEFDYKGWRAWGSWRRTKLLNNNGDNGIDNQKTGWGDEYEAANAGPDSEMTRFEEKREHLFLRKRHNCFLHCDFPSECHHALFRAQQEGRPILREALALDAAAAAAAAGKKNKKFTKRITVAEYKQRRRGTGTTRFVEDLLPRVDEEEADEEEEDNSVSPCSPTSPGDPPGDLMREVQVSPIEREGEQGSGNDDDGGEVPPLSPRRRSLLVATDTPADFAATAAPFSFDDENTYGDDELEGGDDEEEKRRTKSRRKIAQLTGCEGLESFGPFRFDTSSGLSPTSPESEVGGGNHQHHRNLATLDLQAAYSEQAWFSNSSNIDKRSEPLSPKSPERMGKRDRMLALLGRRGPPSPSSPTRSSSSPGGFDMPASRHNDHSQKRQHATDATATGSEEYGSSPDSSPTSTSSSASTNTSAGCSGLVMMDDDDTDADGDVPMRDVGEDDTDESPVTPTTIAHGDEGEEEDLRALLRMRNAFMRGEMI